MAVKAYNPLDKKNLAANIENEFLKTRPIKMDEAKAIKSIIGAGLFAIYYVGAYEPYLPISALNKGLSPIHENEEKWPFAKPIYVGKAIPDGGRKGGQNIAADIDAENVADPAATGKALSKRITEHRNSIVASEEWAKINRPDLPRIEVKDFRFRYLVVEETWINFGERALIGHTRPAWNSAVDGFGNHAQGSGRGGQVRSPWDMLHRGRKFAEKLDIGIVPEGDLIPILLRRIRENCDPTHVGELYPIPQRRADEVESTDEPISP